jgi:hypothetical protein
MISVQGAGVVDQYTPYKVKWREHIQAARKVEYFVLLFLTNICISQRLIYKPRWLTKFKVEWEQLVAI